mmetsp:Transcript_103864/g.276395  ORF Transcript_103864/g.276395 Transcript_103864/m.276395 type:complete len:212 (-) Transcript_103864:136-771(-)
MLQNTKGHGVGHALCRDAREQRAEREAELVLDEHEVRAECVSEHKDPQPPLPRGLAGLVRPQHQAKRPSEVAPQVRREDLGLDRAVYRGGRRRQQRRRRRREALVEDLQCKGQHPHAQGHKHQQLRGHEIDGLAVPLWGPDDDGPEQGREGQVQRQPSRPGRAPAADAPRQDLEAQRALLEERRPEAEELYSTALQVLVLELPVRRPGFCE